MKNTILSIKNLEVSFGEHKIINNLSFDFEKNKIYAITGANGTGKTVLLRSIIGVCPYKGKIELTDNTKIGYLPQKFQISRDFQITVFDFLTLKNKNKETIKEKLMLVGFKEEKEKCCHLHGHLETLLKTKVSDLSGGELQRVMLANALLDNPNLLLLDEPTAGVDLEGEKSFYTLFEALKSKGVTIIFVSHDKDIIQKYADVVINMENYGK